MTLHHQQHLTSAGRLEDSSGCRTAIRSCLAVCYCMKPVMLSSAVVQHLFVSGSAGRLRTVTRVVAVLTAAAVAVGCNIAACTACNAAPAADESMPLAAAQNTHSSVGWCDHDDAAISVLHFLVRTHFFNCFCIKRNGLHHTKSYNAKIT